MSNARADAGRRRSDYKRHQKSSYCQAAFRSSVVWKAILRGLKPELFCSIYRQAEARTLKPAGSPVFGEAIPSSLLPDASGLRLGADGGVGEARDPARVWPRPGRKPACQVALFVHFLLFIAQKSAHLSCAAAVIGFFCVNSFGCTIAAHLLEIPTWMFAWGLSTLGAPPRQCT